MKNEDILNQMSGQNQPQDNLENQIVNTLGWMVIFWLIGWCVRRIISRRHYASGAMFLVFAISAFLVMVNLDMSANAAYFFWCLVLMSVVSLGKAIS